MNQEAVFKALEIMGKGMTGIFAALSILYLFMVGLTKAFPLKEEPQSDHLQD